LWSVIKKLAVLHQNLLYGAIRVFDCAQEVGGCILGGFDSHVLSRKCVWSARHVSLCIIIKKHMCVVWIIIIKNIHSSIGLCKNFIIGKVAIPIFACFEYNPHSAIAVTNTCECLAAFLLLLVTHPFFLATSHNLVKQSL
jgi:hypothetical protein